MGEHDREVERLRARVAALETERDELLYATSHDLAAPLRTLSGFLGLLARRLELDGAEAEMLGHALDGAEHLRVLVEGVLKVSRVATAPFAPESVGLADVLALAREEAAQELARRGAEVHAKALGRVFADAELLRRALVELLRNGAQAREGARIGVRTEPVDGGTLVLVCDDGPGVPADQRARALALLGRLVAWHERPGAGAGLTVVRSVAERHSGYARLDTALGGGLQVVVLLPDSGPGA